MEMSSDQDTSGFLPPSTASFNDELHRQPPSSATTHSANNLPGHANTTAVETTTQESQLAAAIGRAIFNIRDAVAATTTVNTHNTIRRTVSDIPSSAYQESPTTTVTPPMACEPARRNPLRRTMSDTISTDHQEQQKTISKSPNSRTMATHSSSNRSKESFHFKRLKKMEDMVREIEEKCWEVTRESGVAEKHVEDDNPSQAISDQGEEVNEDRVAFKQLEDGSLRIQLSCSCGKHFEFLRKNNECFYRLI